MSKCKMVFAGPPARSGWLSIEISGHQIPFFVRDDATVNDVAAACSAAINAFADGLDARSFPVTSAVSGAVVTLKLRHKISKRAKAQP